jgi:hypothetical protein
MIAARKSGLPSQISINVGLFDSSLVPKEEHRSTFRDLLAI